MIKSQKAIAIDQLKEKFSDANIFYLADSSSLSVAQINILRAKCYEKGIQMHVVKNTLARKALESFGAERGYEGLYDSLHGPTAILFTENASEPAKLIKAFRKSASVDRPIVKAVYVDTAVYIGDDLDALIAIKSKEELVGDIIMLLQSPAKNVISALKSGGSTIAGLLKTLEERAQ
jgi:large subunit ribosomal protein L10